MEEKNELYVKIMRSVLDTLIHLHPLISKDFNSQVLISDQQILETKINIDTRIFNKQMEIIKKAVEGKDIENDKLELEDLESDIFVEQIKEGLKWATLKRYKMRNKE